jgi:hypothetical protein
MATIIPDRTSLTKEAIKAIVEYGATRAEAVALLRKAYNWEWIGHEY